MGQLNGIILLGFFILISYFLIKKFIIKFFRQIKDLNYLRINGKFTDGIIVGYKVDTDADGGRSFLEEIEFCVDGHLISFISKYPVKEEPVVGNKVAVIYDERNPTIAVTDLNRSFFLVLLGLIVTIGALMLLAFLTIKSLVEKV